MVVYSFSAGNQRDLRGAVVGLRGGERRDWIRHRQHPMELSHVRGLVRRGGRAELGSETVPASQR